MFAAPPQTRAFTAPPAIQPPGPVDGQPEEDSDSIWSQVITFGLDNLPIVSPATGLWQAVEDEDASNILWHGGFLILDVTGVGYVSKKGGEVVIRYGDDVIDLVRPLVEVVQSKVATQVSTAVDYVGDKLNGLGEQIAGLFWGGAKKVDDIPEPNRSLFSVGKHGEMPVPRAGQQSHHGVMSAWMHKHFPGYDPDKAPAILMPEINHRATFGVYNTWRVEMKAKLGGVFDWSKISQAEMKDLSERMFDAAGVPANIRTEYWAWFDRMIGALDEQ